MCYRLHMKIDPANKSNTNFQAIVIPESIVRKKILKNLAENEITSLKEILIKQNNNPVNAYIGLDKDRLTAKIFCPYRLKNFKENYKQIPFFESNLNFVKRIAKKCDEYKAQLNNII